MASEKFQRIEVLERLCFFNWKNSMISNEDFVFLKSAFLLYDQTFKFLIERQIEPFFEKKITCWHDFDKVTKNYHCLTEIDILGLEFPNINQPELVDEHALVSEIWGNALCFEDESHLIIRKVIQKEDELNDKLSTLHTEARGILGITEKKRLADLFLNELNLGIKTLIEIYCFRDFLSCQLIQIERFPSFFVDYWLLLFALDCHIWSFLELIQEKTQVYQCLFVKQNGVNE